MNLKYINAKTRINKQIANINEIEDIKVHLKSNYIQCFKYNYALDSIV